MSPAAKVLAAGLELAESERLDVAHELAASVELDADWERSWIEEIQRREAAAPEELPESQDWEQVRERIRSRLPA